jgi:hypothetical protein
VAIVLDERAGVLPDSLSLNGFSNEAEDIFPAGFFVSSGPATSKNKLSAGKERKNHMNPLIQHKTITVLLFIPSAFVCFALSPLAQAVSPAPDGGYPNGNTAEGDLALQSLTTGDHNTAVGNGALFSNSTGFQNTATGAGALLLNNTGFHNTATGFVALFSNTAGNHNTANGEFGLIINQTGNFNTADGAHSLFLTTGDLNIALGFSAGQNLTTGSNNIDVGSAGVAGESNIIRIGNQVAFTDIDNVMHPAHTKTFIAGISGVAAGTDAVFVDTNGQLGVGVPSSARFKTEVTPMDKASEAILALKPVMFRYKKEIDPKGVLRFGLVAEEVEKVNPELVGRDAKGQVNTVRYEAVNAMLLNEFLKEHRTVQDLKSTVAKQEATIAQQQKGMEALATTLREQTAQIQKVNAQLEANKPAPQMVASDK